MTVYETSAKPIALNDENYEEILEKSSLPVLMEFWAPWCHHCQLLMPVLENAAADLAGQVLVGQVNCDLNEKLPEKYGIEVIPTLYLIRGGEVLGSMINPKDKDTLTVWVRDLIG